MDYKIKQEIKYKQYELLIELFDKDTKEPLEGNGNFKNLSTKEKGKLFENKAKHYATFNEKEKIQLTLSHPEYHSEKIIVTGGDGRFAKELKKTKSKYNFFFKNNLTPG